MIKILIIGKSGRVDCIADAAARSSRAKQLYTFAEVNNPGLYEKSQDHKVELGNTEDLDHIEKYARKIRPDFAIIGPEEPLAAGVVDMLTGRLGIPCVGPTRSLAQLESSKSFTRELLSKYGIPGNSEYKVFRNLTGIEHYLRQVGDFVIKPDGLTGGKGVKVFGEHLHSVEEAVRYCESLFGTGQPAVVVEERLDGEEFSLQSLCDGQHVVDTVVVQDHKRANDGDTGPNTGGMGSYSCENHCLPFLSREHLQEASKVNLAVGQALLEEFGEEYKGILYGGFMVTKDGLKVIEYNARFGDPEVLNVLPLLKADFLDVCEAIINGTLDEIPVIFDKKATVCKYVVPQGYPTDPEKGARISLENVPRPSDQLKIFYGAINKQPGGLSLIGSRALAFVGIGNNLEEAEQIAEDAASRVIGPVRHRKDIGTPRLIQKRMNHMREIMEEKEPISLSRSPLDHLAAVAG